MCVCLLAATYHIKCRTKTPFLDMCSSNKILITVGLVTAQLHMNANIYLWCREFADCEWQYVEWTILYKCNNCMSLVLYVHKMRFIGTDVHYMLESKRLCPFISSWYCKFQKIHPLRANALPLFNLQVKFLHRYFPLVWTPHIECLWGIRLVSFWFSSIINCVCKCVHTKLL